ncbi:MAG: hypothetical protein EOM52_01635 [Clostridia bacterium]|nr:hypothetical protein [Clostridia bacterium]
MRRILLPLLLALLLLLTGCTGGKSQPTPAPFLPPPETTPSPSPATQRDWWEGLTADALPIPGGESVTLEDGTVLAALGEAGGGDIALYTADVPTINFVQLLLRYGDKLQAIGGADGHPPVLSALQWHDYDGDGEDELLISLKDGSRTTLSLCEWEDESWTVNSYHSYAEELKAALDFRKEGRTATVTYGSYSAAYAMGPKDRSMGGLSAFHEYVFFNADKPGKISAVFAVGVDVDGSARRFASLTADVDYDGGDFTLRNIKLVPTGGV